jgi:hypothetical protein
MERKPGWPQVCFLTGRGTQPSPGFGESEANMRIAMLVIPICLVLTGTLIVVWSGPTGKNGRTP